MYDQGPWHPQFKFNNLFNKHYFSLASFFSKVQCILSRENCRGVGGLSGLSMGYIFPSHPIKIQFNKS